MTYAIINMSLTEKPEDPKALHTVRIVCGCKEVAKPLYEALDKVLKLEQAPPFEVSMSEVDEVPERSLEEMLMARRIVQDFTRIYTMFKGRF